MRLPPLFLLTCIWLQSQLIAQTAIAQGKPPVLLFNKEIKAQLKAGDEHHYSLNLQAGQFARVRVCQESIGIAYRVFAPDDSLLDDADLNALYQTEMITIHPRQTGNYRVEVYWDYGKPASGVYRILWDQKLPAATTPEGKARQLFEGWYDTNGPGAAVAIIKNGKVVFKSVRGLANIEHQISLRDTSSFDLASVSKQFTAYAIAMLIEKGQLSMNDSIRRYLPELPEFTKPILLRHLIYHTSGLRDWDNLMTASGYLIEDLLNMDMILKMISTNRNLNFSPGDAFSYSNTGYTLLAKIVERVTCQPFASWCREHIFKPLGMKHTRIKDNFTSVIPGRVDSYRAGVDGFTIVHDNLSAPGSSSLYSSIDDLVKWVINLEQDKPGGKGVSALIKTKGQLNNETSFDYAFGNFISQHKGTAKVEHLGLWSGFRTSLARYPDEGLAVIYLANDANDATYQRAWTIAELFLTKIKREPPKKNPLPDLNPYLAKLTPAVAEPDSAKLASFTGVYFARELNTAVTLKNINGVLTFCRSRLNDIPLKPGKENEFFSELPDFNRRLVFQRDSAQKVSSFILTTNGRGIVFTKLQ